MFTQHFCGMFIQWMFKNACTVHGSITWMFLCTVSSISRKGRLEPIVLSVVRRASNRNCTLVDNLELYGIVPDEFARTMQRLAAASTTG